MTKRTYLVLAAALLIAAMATAQDADQKQLNKEITLEKDFVPVEKKATKKNTLPTVKKVSAPARTTLTYSDWAEPTQVPNSIPTLLPYGYRTAHNFSDKRGYLKVGAGTQANFMGSAGYRVLDTEQNTLGVWVQHASTWNGKNNSPLITLDNERLKQKFNDNVLGIDFANNNRWGTFDLSLRGHFDSFNYYGGRDEAWDDRNKQSFLEAGLSLTWQGRPLTIADREVGYNLSLAYNHAGYDKTQFEALKGAKENVLNFTVGTNTALGTGQVGLDLTGDYVSFKGSIPSGEYWTLFDDKLVKHNNFMFTLSPYYGWENDVFRARVGADIIFGDLRLRGESRKVHVAPKLQLDIDIVDGAAIFVDMNGGKTLNTLSALAAQNRYSDPLGRYYNSFSPIDVRAGFKIGPFAGFSAQLYGCYDIIKSDFDTMVPEDADFMGYTDTERYRASHYLNFDSRGFGVGAELAYKYRSLIEAKATFQYAPTGDAVEQGKWYKTYAFGGLDGANNNASLEFNVTPIRPLAVQLGLQYRGGRSYLQRESYVGETGLRYYTDRYLYQDMDDMYNLHVGASYRFDKVVTLWLRGNNLLNRKYDALPGMGAQRISVMGGVSLVF